MPMPSRPFSALDAPCDPVAASGCDPALPPAMVGTLVAIGGLFVAGTWLGLARHEGVRVVGLALGHGALLTAALARAVPGWPWYGAGIVALLLAVGVAARQGGWGALAYLAVPVALLAVLRRERGLAALGMCLPETWPPVAAGAAVGGLLGGHLLVSASLMSGYHVGLIPAASYVAAVAYDAGVNVLSAECFFRGVVFDAYQRRRPVLAALAVSVGAALARYLVDPALPRSVEALAGAVLYLGALSAASCGLFWWSGSLLPGALAGILFFLAYRAVAVS
jgi:hypothetical protein